MFRVDLSFKVYSPTLGMSIRHTYCLSGSLKDIKSHRVIILIIPQKTGKGNKTVQAVATQEFVSHWKLL